MDINKDIEERFNEKFPNPLYDEDTIGSPVENGRIKEFIKEEIKSAEDRVREEIREKINKLDYDDYITSGEWRGVDGDHGYEQAKDDFLSLLSDQINDKEI